MANMTEKKLLWLMLRGGFDSEEIALIRGFPPDIFEPMFRYTYRYYNK